MNRLTYDSNTKAGSLLIIVWHMFYDLLGRILTVVIQFLHRLLSLISCLLNLVLVDFNTSCLDPCWYPRKAVS